ncbi:hypothetical protein DPMN_087820 [Dreissena polymorpha]|uniref:Uncharacterized protein n=1 Tax=Dreissena polymorpha TaxID=45954 RepID=A0A9D4KTW0_DREPO|nr:hypothetical protein DPMN_087820 [Dreissena polymorpha]
MMNNFFVEHLQTYARISYSAFQRTTGALAFGMGRLATEKCLSNTWLSGILHRWNDHKTSLKPAALDSIKAKFVTPESVNSYFENIRLAMTLLWLHENRQMS